MLKRPNRPMIRPYFWSIAAAATVFAAGCNPPDSPASTAPQSAPSPAAPLTQAPPKPALQTASAQPARGMRELQAPGMRAQIRLSPAVTQLSEPMLTGIQLEPDRLTLLDTADPALRGRQPGDILLFEQTDGFWRYIESVEHTGSRLVYHTRPARLNEVIEEGLISLQVRPGPHADAPSAPADADYSTRQQGLGLGDFFDPTFSTTFTKSFDTSLPLESMTQFQVLKQDIEIETRGTLDFKPGFKLEIEIGNFNIQRLEFTALGHLDLNAELLVKANDGGSPAAVNPDIIYRDIPLCSGSASTGNITCIDGKPTFSAAFLGQSIRVFPHLRVGYAWSGAAGGTLKTGMKVQGNVKAGYAFVKEGENQKIFEKNLTGQALTPEYTGSLDLDLKTSMRLGLTASLNGEPVMEAYPFEGIFAAEASTLAPACGLSASLDVTGKVLRHGFMGAGSWPLYDLKPIDFFHPVDAPGCTTDTTEHAQTCSTANPTCPAGSVCNQGYCIEDTPLQISLNWTRQDADLNLVVINPDGELLQPSASGDAQPATQGWMPVTSCAGTCADGTAAGNNYTEIALFRLPEDGRQYRFRVRNNTPNPAPGSADIDYILQLSARDKPVNIITGTLPATSAAESFDYIYTYSPPF